jgi:hypothetical protein
MEPGSRKELGQALQSLEISFTRRLNRLLGAKGAVFSDRYHGTILNSPTRARNALAYVLSNESRHRGKGFGTYFVGPFSSGHAFQGWRELFGKQYRFAVATDWSLGEIERWLAELVVPARTWYLRAGWRKVPLARMARLKAW